MPIWPFQVSGPAQGEVPPFVPQPSSTRQVSSTGLSRRCCLRASPDRPTRLRLAVLKWTRRQGEETPLGPSSGEETPISQDGMSYRVRSLPSSLFHPSNRALPSDCVARVEKLTLAQVLARTLVSREASRRERSCFQRSLWALTAVGTPGLQLNPSTLLS